MANLSGSIISKFSTPTAKNFRNRRTSDAMSAAPS